MKKIITIFLTVLTLTGCHLTKQNPDAGKKAEIAKKMTEWCEKKSTLTEERRITVEALLKEAGTDDCEKAGERLSNLENIYLSESNISDLLPVADLTNLRGLDLEDNNITDLTQLSNLSNLVSLRLRGNNIGNLAAISNLTNLNSLSLSGNNISDLKPLSKLVNLVELELDSNQINDVALLSYFKKLESLS
ncbi:MAG: leucine-rich repeat domain-containing protein, partial [Cyanobacteria bacterium J06636_27]